MSRINRRALMHGMATLTLISCTSTGAASPGLIQANTVMAAVINAAMQEVPLFNLMLPKLMPTDLMLKLMNPEGTGLLDLANMAETELAAALNKGLSDMTGAQKLDVIMGYFNQAMQLLGPVLSAVGGTGSGIVDAQAILQDIILAAPLVEMFIDSVIVPAVSTRPAARRAASLHGARALSPEAAYADLKVRMAK